MKILLLLSVMALCTFSGCDQKDEDTAPEEASRWFNNVELSGVTDEELDRAVKGGTEKRCGWVDNPSPGNAYLTDEDGEWIIAMQGAYSAIGDLPDFGDLLNETTYVASGNGSYGYGCVCLTVKTLEGGEDSENRIVQIVAGKVLPLAECRKNKKVAEPEGL